MIDKAEIIRKAKCYMRSQKEAAKEMDLNQPYLSLILSGETNPGLKSLEKISAWVDEQEKKLTKQQ